MDDSRPHSYVPVLHPNWENLPFNVTVMEGFSAQQLLDAGSHVVCRSCGFLVDAGPERCPRCRHPHALQQQPTRTVKRRRSSARRRQSRPAEAVVRNGTGDAVLTSTALGGMKDRLNRTIWLVAHGDPRTQGSMVAVATGYAKAADPAMYAWRDTITAEALRELGVRWDPIDGPCLIDAAFTLPPPRGLQDQSCRIKPVVPGEQPRVPAMQPPDRDKLLRAVHDALAPLDHANKGGKLSQSANTRFKVVVDDSRSVYGAEAKTYARPGHTHAWALDRPGVVIRVRMIDTPGIPFPEPTLYEPGDLPDEAARLHQRLCRRT